MRLLAGFEISGQARYLSHLDFQRALQRILRRAELPLAYSSGFNPHPLISYASARPVGATSSLEVVELQLSRAMPEKDALEAMRANAAPGVVCGRVRAIEPNFPKLAQLVYAAAYEIVMSFDIAKDDISISDIATRVMALLDNSTLTVQKRGKAGIKPLNLLPLIYERDMKIVSNEIVLNVIGAHTQQGSLPVGLLAGALIAGAVPGHCRLHRSALLAKANDGAFINILDFEPAAPPGAKGD